jgi:hypothetical protein
MVTGEAILTVRRKYQTLSRIMDERMRRRWAASEAIALGWGGITAIHRGGLARQIESVAESAGQSLQFVADCGEVGGS